MWMEKQSGTGIWISVAASHPRSQSFGPGNLGGCVGNRSRKNKLMSKLVAFF